MEPGLDVSVIPHLYDLHAEHTGRLFLESVGGDLVVLSWLFPRAAFWVLDRDGIKGRWGETQLRPADEEPDAEEAATPEPPRGIGASARRTVAFTASTCATTTITIPMCRRFAESRPIAVRATRRNRLRRRRYWWSLGWDFVPRRRAFAPDQLLQAPGRRWYPVIDYSRCTNCMECIDFCLFGVYGVDEHARINVENQDNCKKGCPACSRVCPEQAIMFPDYKTPAIAGAAVGAVAGLKIDLTRLFGGENKDALSQAVLERDRELVNDGRDAVGVTVGMPKRQTGKEAQPKDELDNLMDALDALEL